MSWTAFYQFFDRPHSQPKTDSIAHKTFSSGFCLKFFTFSTLWYLFLDLFHFFDDIKYILNMIISAVDLDKWSDEDIEDIAKKFEREEEEGGNRCCCSTSPLRQRRIVSRRKWSTAGKCWWIYWFACRIFFQLWKRRIDFEQQQTNLGRFLCLRGTGRIWADAVIRGHVEIFIIRNHRTHSSRSFHHFNPSTW